MGLGPPVERVGSVNRVELMGSLIEDPKQQQLESGFTFCRFTLAVNGSRWSSSAGHQIVTTDFLGCHAWAEVGARAMRELHKGDEVHLVGKLDQRQNVLEDGKKDAHTRVVVFTYDVVRKARTEV